MSFITNGGDVSDRHGGVTLKRSSTDHLRPEQRNLCFKGFILQQYHHDVVGNLTGHGLRATCRRALRWFARAPDFHSSTRRQISADRLVATTAAGDADGRNRAVVSYRHRVRSDSTVAFWRYRARSSRATLPATAGSPRSANRAELALFGGRLSSHASSRKIEDLTHFCSYSSRFAFCCNAALRFVQASSQAASVNDKTCG